MSTVVGAPAPVDVMRVITRMNIGGPARQAILLTKGLVGEFSTLLVAGRPPAVEGELQDPDAPVHYAPLVRPLEPRTDMRALWALRRLLREANPQIVHTHMAKAGSLGRLASLSQRRRPLLIHTYHGHVLQGYFSGAQQRLFLETERRLAYKTDLLIAVSPEVRDELINLGVGDPKQFRVIPLGFDLSAHLDVGGQSGVLRPMIGIGAGTPLIGVVGRLVPIKDHATLFHAMVSVTDAHLVVLGDGELRQQLEALALKLGISARVHFLGWWHNMPVALADLDLVVLSSQNEGTPVALIEALAAARPVVATDVGGVRHVVQDGETGWLCPAADPPALASRIEHALRHASEAAAFAALGRERVAERFSKDRMVDDHVAIYKKLLASRSGRV